MNEIQTTPTDDAAEWDRYVFVERPRCPRCESTDLQTKRSIDQGGRNARDTILHYALA